jgi:hypothetical protein
VGCNSAAQLFIVFHPPPTGPLFRPECADAVFVEGTAGDIGQCPEGL